MKALLRRDGDKFYVWKDAEYNAGRNRYRIEGDEYSPIEILTVKGDDSSECVVCRHCGEKIKNDPESIERHFAEQEAKADCMHCDKIRITSRRYPSYELSPQENGRFEVKETYSADVSCGMSYERLTSPNVKSNCIHYACRRKGVTEYGDILMKNPDLFETQITVDLLDKKKYKLTDSYDGHFYYDLKCRGTLYAIVNEYGIVDHFLLKYKYRNTRFYYSSTQEKLFFGNNGAYDEHKPYYLSDTKYDQVRDRIVSLFKEAKANE